MNLFRFFSALCLISLTGLFSCSNFSSSYLTQIDRLLVLSDSVVVELNAIDPITVEEWLEISMAGKRTFVEGVQEGDTLELMQAQELDAFLRANKQLQHLNEERKRCHDANVAIKYRLKELRKDIENGSGDRATYKAHVKNEADEMNRIRKHSKSLRRVYDESKAAIEQFEH